MVKELINGIPQFDKQETKYLYALAIQKMHLQDYKNAIDLLMFLSTSNPDETQYLKALAGCLHADEQYRRAIFFYEFVFSREPANNLDCLFFLADCYLRLEYKEQARDNLLLFQEGCDSNAEYGASHRKYLSKTKLLLNGILNV